MANNFSQIEEFFAEDAKKFFNMFRQDRRNLNEYIKYSFVRFSDKMNKIYLQEGLTHAVNSIFEDKYHRYGVFITSKGVEVCREAYDDHGWCDCDNYEEWVAYSF